MDRIIVGAEKPVEGIAAWIEYIVVNGRVGIIFGKAAFVLNQKENT